jgi:hypothetical protein
MHLQHCLIKSYNIILRTNTQSIVSLPCSFSLYPSLSLSLSIPLSFLLYSIRIPHGDSAGREQTHEQRQSRSNARTRLQHVQTPSVNLSPDRGCSCCPSRSFLCLLNHVQRYPFMQTIFDVCSCAFSTERNALKLFQRLHGESPN